MSNTQPRLLLVMALFLSRAVYAQSANEMVSPLEVCSQSARAAHEVCRGENDADRRLACVDKVSMTHLQCLERSLSDVASDSSKATPSEPTANAASSEPALKVAPPNASARTAAGARVKESLPPIPKAKPANADAKPAAAPPTKRTKASKRKRSSIPEIVG